MTQVVVTGIGIISPIGSGIEQNLFSLRTGAHGLSKADFFESRYVDAFPFGEVKVSNLAMKDRLGRGAFNDYTRTCMLAWLALKEALSDAGLQHDDLADVHTGLISASTVGGMCYTDQLYADANARGEGSVFLSSYSASSHTDKLTSFFGIQGFSGTINTACSSSANAIALGYRLIRSGRLKRVIVGGADSLAKYTVNGFISLRILSDDFCRPFDAGRKGLNLGEAAAYLVLEEESVAGSKKHYGRILGYGNSNDAHHASAISPEATGVINAIKGALTYGGISPDSVGYVNTHGTGTLNNDEMELLGMRRVFGVLPPFSSTKSFTGHTLGAAGAVEAIYSLMALYYSELYPNLRFQKPIDSNDATPVLHYRNDTALDYVLSNSFGFSGNCTSLLFGR